MGAAPKTYGDIESFVTMLLAACDDMGMNETLDQLLSLPDEWRQRTIRDLIAQLRIKGAPAELVEALAPLLDDDVAEKAYEVIYRCRREK
jgi:hypothetical protein